MSLGVGRLAWKSPVGAILWETWERRKWHFALHALGFLAGALSVRWLQHTGSEIVRAILRILLLSTFLSACLDVLTCFAYMATDAHKVQIGYPGMLLLKPVRTVRLALIPMALGGAALVVLLFVWGTILAPLLPAVGLNPLWLGAVLLSFFWWMQALGWSLPDIPGRSLVLVGTGVVHLLVALIPLASSALLLRLRGPILVAMLGLAPVTAVNGLRWMRCGRWEGPPRLAAWHAKIRGALSRKTSPKFSSAFQAQFWLEWHRQGRVLPGMCGAIAVTALPLVDWLLKMGIAPGVDNSFVAIAVAIMLLIPLMLSGAVGPAMARFDPLRATDDLPVYISIRPMTNGGFVLTKLMVALVSSALAWLLMLVIGVATLFICQPGARLPSGLPYGLAGILVGCFPPLLLLVLLTWTNLVSGIAAGLSGRRWVIGIFTFGKSLAGISLFGIAIAAKYDPDFREALLRWLLPLLALCLVAKIGLSLGSFCWGLGRNAITPGAIGWIVGGWLACGLFVAGYAALLCHALNRPGYWVYATLAGFLIVPLADLAFAPMALAWNRHR